MPDKVLREIFNKHLPYEIDMMRRTYSRIEALAHPPRVPETPEERVLRNALIESFCVHCRSLLDFFGNYRFKSSGAIAADFKAFKTGLDQKVEPLKSIREKLNKEIFHLTKDRPALETDQFDVGTDGTKLVKMLEQEIARFLASPSTDFQDLKPSTIAVVISGLPFSAASTSISQGGVTTFGHTGSLKPK
jgi:hypothetical protein